jgi:hypothetical protein
MKYLLPPAFLAYLLLAVSAIRGTKVNIHPVPASPLAIYSSAWNDPKYLKCNTAEKAGFLQPEEKELIYILNLARSNPSLFANTVVQQYPGKTGQLKIAQSRYYKSLLKKLEGLKPMNILYLDSLCFESAYCHASVTGKNGTVTHTRTTKECLANTYFDGECCDYGNSKAIDILFSLLLDEGVASLGHRKICLDNYNKIGVSIQPHTRYRRTAVLDFKY